MADAHAALPLERHRLANGLDIVLQHDDHLPLVAVNLWYHVGSKNERPGKTGFAHLFEHMLFQGSAHVGTNDHFAHLQKIGGVANGSTWYDRTNYYETVPAHELELALWLESDRMGFLLPAMTQEKLDTQREVVMNERRQRVDNQPYGRALERLNELLYPPLHPYHWPIIGTMDDLAAASLDDVCEFFTRYYHPGNAVLTLAGDFDSRVALEMIERYFGDIPRAPAPPPVVASRQEDEPPQDRTAELKDDVQLSRVYIAYRIPPFGSDGWDHADMLAAALTAGKSSPMYRDLVIERQIAQDVAARALPTELNGTFLVVATARPETTAQDLLAAIDEHLAAVRSEPLSESAFERCRNALLTAYTEQLQALDQRADILGQSTTLLGAPERYRDRLQAYAGITPKAVRDFAAQELLDPNRAVVSVLPKDGGP